MSDNGGPVMHPMQKASAGPNVPRSGTTGPQPLSPGSVEIFPPSAGLAGGLSTTGMGTGGVAETAGEGEGLSIGASTL